MSVGEFAERVAAHAGERGGDEERSRQGGPLQHSGGDVLGVRLPAGRRSGRPSTSAAGDPHGVRICSLEAGDPHGVGICVREARRRTAPAPAPDRASRTSRGRRRARCARPLRSTGAPEHRSTGSTGAPGEPGSSARSGPSRPWWPPARAPELSRHPFPADDHRRWRAVKSRASSATAWASASGWRWPYPMTRPGRSGGVTA